MCTDIKSREAIEKILVFQQNGRGESKSAGIVKYGRGLFNVEIISIKDPLPLLLDDTSEYLPDDFEADVVLDFLKHPDLSHDLALACGRKGVPVVASGKKVRLEEPMKPHTPPT